ncbi:MAG: DUF2147 domain-containing protein [Sulfitobacter sp.]
MRIKVWGLSLFVLASLSGTMPTFAQNPFGIWQTNEGKTGAYLHIRVAPCHDNTDLLCGYIHKAFKTPHTQIVGRRIFWNLAPSGPGKWHNGMVWDIENGKAYRATLSLTASTLRIEGCLGPICKGQDWAKVQ